MQVEKISPCIEKIHMFATAEKLYLTNTKSYGTNDKMLAIAHEINRLMFFFLSFSNKTRIDFSVHDSIWLTMNTHVAKQQDDRQNVMQGNQKQHSPFFFGHCTKPWPLSAP